MGRLDGKKALVTAAAQGIGRQTATAFAEAGADVIATDINVEGLEELKTKYGLVIHYLDVTNSQGVARLPAEFGKIDILFNCVGHVHDGTILDREETDWFLSWELNVTSMYRIIRALLPEMIKGGGGNIINMSSIVSSLKAAPSRFAYGTTKAAVVGLTKSIARDFVGDGIRCNAICPGTVETPFWEE